MVVTESALDDYSSLTRGTEILILDRYSAKNCASVQWLEGVCDGTKMLRVKYSGPVQSGDIVLIVLSNWHPHEIYEDELDRKIIDVRFKYYDLDLINNLNL